MVTVHGRSRQQRYTKLADWNYIYDCKKASDSMPVFGNGDVLSWEEYYQHSEQEGLDGVLLARGPLVYLNLTVDKTMAI